MSEQLALYRNILEAPDDDNARLVYADWLEEHSEKRLTCYLCNDRTHGTGNVCAHCWGTPESVNLVPVGYKDRAEFIRRQCDYHRTQPKEKWSVRHDPAMQQRTRELLFDNKWRNAFDWFPISKWRLMSPHAVFTELRYEPEDVNVPRPSLWATLYRGFITRLKFPGEFFTEVVNAVCPDIEKLCEECGGTKWKRYYTKDGDWEEGECSSCHGSGRVSLPVSLTMQPVESIVLTRYLLDEYQSDRVASTKNWLNVKYPFRGFTIELPDGSVIQPTYKRSKTDAEK